MQVLASTMPTLPRAQKQDSKRFNSQVRPPAKKTHVVSPILLNRFYTSKEAEMRKQLEHVGENDKKNLKEDGGPYS